MEEKSSQELGKFCRKELGKNLREKKRKELGKKARKEGRKNGKKIVKTREQLGKNSSKDLLKKVG